MLKKYLSKSKDINSFSKKYINYLHNVFSSLDLKKLNELEKEFLKLRSSNSTLFSVGNGEITLQNLEGTDLSLSLVIN